jgi:hypothetical protein
MKLTPPDGELKEVLASGRSNITPMIATRSKTIDITVKWQLNPRKRIQFVNGRSSWSFLGRPP